MEVWNENTKFQDRRLKIKLNVTVSVRVYIVYIVYYKLYIHVWMYNQANGNI